MRKTRTRATKSRSTVSSRSISQQCKRSCCLIHVMLKCQKWTWAMQYWEITLVLQEKQSKANLTKISAVENWQAHHHLWRSVSSRRRRRSSCMLPHSEQATHPFCGNNKNVCTTDSCLSLALRWLSSSFSFHLIPTCTHTSSLFLSLC